MGRVFKLSLLVNLVFASLCLAQDLPELPCLNATLDNVFTLTVSSNATEDMGRINLFYVQHDGRRLMPLATTALYNELNQIRTYPRKDQFRRHRCPYLYDDKQARCEQTFKTTPEQATISGRTSWDRGQLQPSNPFRFSEEANSCTFYCVNIAPQDPWTNQQPWTTVESATDIYTSNRPAYVMTGVCDRDSIYSPTMEGYRVPDCFWKLVCYKDAANETQVVGFIGNNTLLNWSDAVGKADRRETTTLPRGQQEVLDVMTREFFVFEAWAGAQTWLHFNRNEDRVPLASECRAKLTIDQDVIDDWNGVIRRVERERLLSDTDDE